MMILWITSHLFQDSLVILFCSNVAVPNTSPCILLSSGDFVNRLTRMTTKIHKRNIHPQKKSQFMSKKRYLNMFS